MTAARMSRVLSAAVRSAWQGYACKGHMSSHVRAVSVPVVGFRGLASETSGSQPRLSPVGHKVRRFYDKVEVVPVGSEGEESADVGYTVLLQGRRLKTPAGSPFVVPDETLAQLVGLEWDRQQKEIEPHTMHVSSLCNTILDNPTFETPETLTSKLLSFLETDTVCVRDDFPETLVEMQQEAWDPLVSWFNKQYGVDLAVTHSIQPPRHNAEDLERVRSRLAELNAWQLHALQYATETSKSLVIALALKHGHISAHEAAAAARVEVIFQTSRFGEVEWAHPLEKADTETRLAAASVVMKLAPTAS